MSVVQWLTVKGDAYFAAAALSTVMAVGCAGIVLAAEAALLGFRRSSLHAICAGEPSARRDLLSFGLDITGLLRLLGHACTLGLGYAASRAVMTSSRFDLFGAVANPALQVAVVLVVRSFCDYWMHRWLHRSPVLWEIHKYHHAASEMNILTAHREGVLYSPFIGLVLAMSLALTGVPVHTYIAVVVLLELHGFFVHSRLQFGLGWLHYVFVSPRAHRLHHALDAARYGCNYGGWLSVWDHLFGTYSMSADGAHPVGVTDEIYNHAPWHREMAYSFAATGRAIAAALHRTPPVAAVAID